jgi:hypothetical protein
MSTSHLKKPNHNCSSHRPVKAFKFVRLLVYMPVQGGKTAKSFHSHCNADRVTRLCEFSPFRTVVFWTVFKLKQMRKFLGLLLRKFLQVIFVLTLTKNVLIVLILTKNVFIY